MARVRNVPMVAQIYQATEDFSIVLDGVPYQLRRGDTVEGGHPLLKGNARWFEPVRATYRVEPEPPADEATEDVLAKAI